MAPVKKTFPSCEETVLVKYQQSFKALVSGNQLKQTDSCILTRYLISWYLSQSLKKNSQTYAPPLN